jgi:tetrahydromethanopterin S-methyltransferase subunit G
MDDKVFNLLEKMYAEMNEKFDQVNQRFDKVDSRLTKIESTMENDIIPDIKLALQGYHDTNEKLTTIDEKIDNLADKVDRHDIKIQVIEGGKRA